MSDVKIEIAQASARTTTGEQDFTNSALGGSTPKAAIVFAYNHSGTFGTEEPHMTQSIGFCTADDENISGVRSWDDNTTSACSRTNTSIGCVRLFNPDGSGVNDIVQTALFVEFIADGLTLNWSAATTEHEFSIVVVLFAGDDLSAEMVVFSPNNTEDASTAVTLAFEANLLFLHTCFTEDGDFQTSNTYHSFGVCTNDGTTVRQAGWTILDSHNRGTAQTAGKMFDGSCIGEQHRTAGSYSIELENFDGTGFDATTRDTAVSGTDDIFVLAINLPSDVDAHVSVVDTPTSTGTEDYTAAGFMPQFAMFGQTRHTAVNTRDATGIGSSVGIGVATDSEEFSSMSRMEDAVATMNTGNIVDDKIINLPADTDTATTPIEADFDSFLSTGVRVNFSSVTTARKFWLLTIEEAVAVAPGKLQLSRFGKIHSPEPPYDWLVW